MLTPNQNNYLLDMDVNKVQVVTIHLAGTAAQTGDTATAFTSASSFVVFCAPSTGGTGGDGGAINSNIVPYIVDSNTVGVKTVDGSTTTAYVDVVCIGS